MMADGLEFSLVGVDELIGKLDSIKQDVRKKGGRFALRKAANIVRNKAKANAMALDDSATGRSIADNIDLRFSSRTFKQSGDLKFRIGVKQGAKLAGKGEAIDTGTGGATPHWRLLEFGTEKMRARPFMRNALADSIAEVTNEFVAQYDKALDRAIKRAKK